MPRLLPLPRHLAHCLLLLLIGSPLGTIAEDVPPTAPLLPPAPAPFAHPLETREYAALQSLEALDKALSSQERQVNEIQRRLIAAEDDVTRQALADDLRESREQLADQRLQFERFALEIDLRPFMGVTEQPFDWQEELSKLLKPILAELESATAESREIGNLRAELKQVRERKELAEQAVARLERLLGEAPSEALRLRLEERLEYWQRIARDSANNYTALDLQLQNRLEQRQSVLDETTAYARNFFQTRGMNLVLAVTAFSVVFFGVRAISSLVSRLLVSRATDQAAGARFSGRLTTLLLHVFSVLGGLIAMMLVFNMAGDWFMLGIIIIFLIGIGWASIKTLPSQIETVKLVLNIGTVREGERLEFNGVPYHVEVLGFSVRLVNPRLDGGVQELPVKALVGLHSRPHGAEEAWFPTYRGDWIELADGRIGQVVRQSPSAVHLGELGGADVVYPTAVFVGLCPRRLSERFRLVSRFAIDYQHQALAASEIPARMQERLVEKLPEVVASDRIQAIRVHLESVADASINYLIHVDLKGDAVPDSPRIKDAIQRLLMGVCHEHAWRLPATPIHLLRDSD
ncbi:hypothetical protein CKO25_17470 [Thiocapsa imhoffii]|uniref:Mechanosensitive ion channel n=1 Tax=Thiocapsa imhoffii TaxID=382777 RepID=A0A9X0WLS2_9GAMM|nr:hypothetical protein [Thiocapsa imhoffii]MBK1646402.1 hypothetical protein [Thiocapsa imhoffii]